MKKLTLWRLKFIIYSEGARSEDQRINPLQN